MQTAQDLYDNWEFTRPGTDNRDYGKINREADTKLLTPLLAMGLVAAVGFMILGGGTSAQTGQEQQAQATPAQQASAPSNSGQASRGGSGKNNKNNALPQGAQNNNNAQNGNQQNGRNSQQQNSLPPGADASKDNKQVGTAQNAQPQKEQTDSPAPQKNAAPQQTNSQQQQ